MSRAGELDGVRSDLLRAAVDDLIGTSDVYLMHSDCFHAVASNARPTPRVMATSVVSRTLR